MAEEIKPATNDGAEQTPPPAPTGGDEEQTLDSGTQQPSDGGRTPNQPAPDNTMFWLVILAGIWLWVIWGWRKNKKKQQEREDELKGVQKGDKVATIGGLHATVVSTTDDTMTLKPDDKAAATLTFDRRALSKVLSRKGESTSETKDENK